MAVTKAVLKDWSLVALTAFVRVGQLVDFLVDQMAQRRVGPLVESVVAWMAAEMAVTMAA